MEKVWLYFWLLLYRKMEKIQQQRTKKQQRTVGAIFRLRLRNAFVYGRILEDDLAFYNAFTEEELSENQILSLPILFIVMVSDYAITKTYWQKISKSIPLEKHLQKDQLPPKYFYDGKNYRIVKPDDMLENDQIGTITSLENCENLEYWAVWTPENIEKRLLAYFDEKQKNHL